MSKNVKVALFPLTNSITMLNIGLPYHIFEMRYRTMIEECLSTNTMICVVPPQESFYDVSAVAGMPQVIKEYPDGRKDIVINGEVKIVLKDKIQNSPYLIYESEMIEEKERELSDAQRENFTLLKDMLMEHLHNRFANQFTQEQKELLLSSPQAIYSYCALLFLKDIKLQQHFVGLDSNQAKLAYLIDMLQIKEVQLSPFLPKVKLTKI